MFIILLSLNVSLRNECVSLNDEPCMVRPNFIDLNPFKLNYYPFMVSFDKCSRSGNVPDQFPTKICVPSETKYVNV